VEHLCSASLRAPRRFGGRANGLLAVSTTAVVSAAVHKSRGRRGPWTESLGTETGAVAVADLNGKVEHLCSASLRARGRLGGRANGLLLAVSTTVVISAVHKRGRRGPGTESLGTETGAVAAEDLNGKVEHLCSASLRVRGRFGGRTSASPPPSPLARSLDGAGLPLLTEAYNAVLARQNRRVLTQG